MELLFDNCVRRSISKSSTNYKPKYLSKIKHNNVNKTKTGINKKWWTNKSL